MFTWEGKKIAMKPIPPVPRPTEEEKQKFTFICNRDEFLVESRNKVKICFGSQRSNSIH